MRGQDRGCAFVNAYAEIGGTDHPGNAVIREDKRYMRALFVRLVAEAGIPDPGAVGAHATCSTRARSSRDRGRFRRRRTTRHGPR